MRTVAAHYEHTLVLARAHHIAGEMHAYNVYRADRFRSHYLYSACINVFSCFADTAARIRATRLQRAQRAINAIWDRVSEGLMSEDAAEAACADIRENPGLADLVEVLCEP